MRIKRRHETEWGHVFLGVYGGRTQVSAAIKYAMELPWGLIYWPRNLNVFIWLEHTFVHSYVRVYVQVCLYICIYIVIKVIFLDFYLHVACANVNKFNLQLTTWWGLFTNVYGPRIKMLSDWASTEVMGYQSIGLGKESHCVY